MQPANVFFLDGGGVTGTVALAAIDGRPDVDLQFDGYALRAPKIAQGLGALVVSSLVSQQIDGDRVDISILIPAVNVNGAAQPIDTIAVITTNKNSIGGPRMVNGQLQTYAVVRVSGTASFAES